MNKNKELECYFKDLTALNHSQHTLKRLVQDSSTLQPFEINCINSIVFRLAFLSRSTELKKLQLITNEGVKNG